MYHLKPDFGIYPVYSPYVDLIYYMVGTSNVFSWNGRGYVAMPCKNISGNMQTYIQCLQAQAQAGRTISPGRNGIWVVLKLSNAELCESSLWSQLLPVQFHSVIRSVLECLAVRIPTSPANLATNSSHLVLNFKWHLLGGLLNTISQVGSWSTEIWGAPPKLSQVTDVTICYWLLCIISSSNIIQLIRPPTSMA